VAEGRQLHPPGSGQTDFRSRGQVEVIEFFLVRRRLLCDRPAGRVVEEGPSLLTFRLRSRGSRGNMRAQEAHIPISLRALLEVTHSPVRPSSHGKDSISCMTRCSRRLHTNGNPLVGNPHPRRMPPVRCGFRPRSSKNSEYRGRVSRRPVSPSPWRPRLQRADQLAAALSGIEACRRFVGQRQVRRGRGARRPLRSALLPWWERSSTAQEHKH